MPDSGLPAYTVRSSARAKRVILRLSMRTGFEVVIPKGFDPGLVPELVAGRSQWIRHQTQLLRERGWDPAAPVCMPKNLELRAQGRSVRLTRAPDPRKVPRLIPSGPDTVLLSGDLDDNATCRSLVQGWLKTQARRHFLPRLRRLSAQHDLPFERAQFRAQKSRWGSCSARGTISLNCTLLFLPPALADYVLMHELCHTRHLDHSPAYWQLLEQELPQSRALDAELGASDHVPAWLR